MKVRAKGLVFSPVGEGMNQSAEAFGLTYVVRPAFCGGWEWWLCLKTECKPAASLADAQSACQSDFDRRWREATEVPDLVWEDADFGFWYASEDRYCIARVGEKFDAWFRSKPGSEAVEFGASDSLDLAQSACNAHNRAAVLGE